MTLRARIGVISAVAVAAAILLASVGIYVATARTLLAGVDGALGDIVEDVHRMGHHPRDAVGPRPGRLGAAGGYVQVVTAAGRVVGPPGGALLPVDDRTLAIARGEVANRYFMTADVDGSAVRILAVPTTFDAALQVARPLDEVADALGALRRRLLAGGVLGVGLAAVLGTVVAARAVRPVRRLTAVAEEVAATGDLGRRIEEVGEDEIGRLAHTFNAMLGALEESRAAQEQLVADASHELRTPLTSLRTNIEVLAREDELDAAARDDLIRDVVVQLDEFGRLVGALVELARGSQPARATTEVRLDAVAERVVAMARSRTGGDPAIRLDASPTVVRGEEDRLERAIANLVDNAIKYGAGYPVEVVVADGTVQVRDHGPGIASEHRAHVFERFYRAPEARGAPGSGLGLAIVGQVAAAHGGRTEVSDAPGGGAVVSLALPTIP